MKIKTDKGNVFEAEWITSASRMAGHVVTQILDDRPLSEIAAEIEGVKVLTVIRQRGEKTIYDIAGLAGLTREGDTVALRMLPGGNEDA